MESKAEKFRAAMVKWIGDKATEQGSSCVSKKAGIVKVEFDDGSYVDFTEPKAFTKKWFS